MSRIFVSLALVALFGICRSSARQHTVHGCKDGQVMLNCRTGNIQIVNVVLGDSSCYGARCCPRGNDCMGAPSSSYRDSVHRSCNGVAFCAVGVEIRSIGCSAFAPKNDYVNITYECLVPTTTTATSMSPSLPTTRPASASDPVMRVDPFSKSVQSPVSQGITTAPGEDLNHSTEKSPKSGSKTTSYDIKTASQQPTKTTPASVKSSTTTDEKIGIPEPVIALHQRDGYDNENLDGVTKLAVVIVAGVVITATVISVAVVIALKKRRVVAKNEDYVMPTITSCPAQAADDTERNANLYDFIPDIRDSGNWSTLESTRAEDASGGEDPYLKPVIDEMDQQHYIWIP